MCNHCPTSQAYEQRIIRLTSDYASKGVKVVAISPNAPPPSGWTNWGTAMSAIRMRR
jgi:hypothetical protein